MHPNGTLRVNLAVDTDYTDPTLAQHVVSAQYFYATQAKLLNYPDKPGGEGTQLVPEVAEDYPEMSNGGRAYTFRVRSGSDAYRFNTGETVTAEHFAAAINRALHPRMSSPAAPFLRDVVGAEDVLEGRAERASGVRVLSGNRLQIEMAVPAPDFMHRVAMLNFGAIPEDLPLDPEGVLTPSSAGPYYIAHREPKSNIVLRRNPYYRHARPHGVEEIVYTVGIDPDEGIRQIQENGADYVADGIPATAEAGLGAKYGVNQGQFMVNPSMQLDYIAFNCARPLFGDPWVRRAVSYAIDRPAILRARGAYAGIVATHVLPAGMPGYRHEHIYPANGPDYERARAELPKNFAGGCAIVYTWDTLAGPRIGQIVKENLSQIGIDAEVKEWPETTMHLLAGKRGEPFDLVLSGWTADYPDPYAFLNPLLDGTTIRDANNANDCYFYDPAYNLRMQEAATLSPPERYAVYGNLDLEIMQNAAPMVACDNRTKRDFVSSRVKGAFQHPLYGVDLCALTLS